jgi:hypothetical protein
VKYYFRFVFFLLCIRLVYVERSLNEITKTKRDLQSRVNVAEHNFNLCKFILLQR